MKKVATILPLACLLTTSVAWGQTILYSETFNGASHSFTLNTGDAGSAASPIANQWLVNNSYTGGTGSFTCMGFPFTFSVAATPQQPLGISGNPSSKYLHISSFAAQSSGISNANFLAADGVCTMDEINFSKMSSDISTIGYDSIELSFWWMCGGGSTTYGEVFYSTNGGGSWTVIATPINQYLNQTNWTQQKITIPQFKNQATLRVGFRFFNQTAASATEPSFSIDDVVFTGFNNVSIGVSNVSGTSFCPGEAIQVDYAAAGNFTAGNTFTAQLSNAVGSFASPTVLGSVSSTATTGTINGTIPAGTAAGTGYRVRVVSSNPGGVGSDNGNNLTIAQGADAGTLALTIGTDTVCPNTMIQLQATGAVGTITWQSSTNGTDFVNEAPASLSANFAPAQSTWYRAILTNGCGSDTSATYYIHTIPTPSATFNYSQNGNSFDITFTNNTAGTFTSSDWEFGDGFSGSQTNPTYGYDAPGDYIVTLTITTDEGCTSSYTDTITVQPLSSVGNLLLETVEMTVFPNPNQGQWTTEWTWETSGEVVMDLIDLQGRQVQVLYNGFLAAGTHRIEGAAPASGLYILRVQTAQGIAQQRVVVR